ncbi:MAG: T9SS type A sorting domain-containing protein, partial [Bacteroidota bacterium]
FRLYPNPAQNQLNLAFREAVAIDDLLLYDMSGRPLRPAYTQYGPQTKIDLGGLPAGLYILRVQTQLGSIQQRVQILPD